MRYAGSNKESMVNSALARYDLDVIMPQELWLILIFIVVVIVYTIAKVRKHMRVSEEQWEQVDKSKLREWEDDD